MNNFCLRLYC